MRTTMKRFCIFFLVCLFVIQPIAPVLAVDDAVLNEPESLLEPAPMAEVLSTPPESVPVAIEPEVPPRDRSYSAVMRRLYSGESDPELISDLRFLFDSEQERLDKLGVAPDKSHRYLQFIENQLEARGVVELGWQERLGDFVGDILGQGRSQPTLESLAPESEPFRLPPKPATFDFGDPMSVGVTPFTPHLIPLRNPSRTGLFNQLKNIFVVPSAYALDDSVFPTIADVQADQGEVAITPAMQDLAAALNNNPAQIFNYLRNNIRYEPYYGAKKGSIGCLRDRLCNDTDSASLAIAILRAAGIPARYKKAIAVMSTQSLQSMLGVDETRTVFLALGLGKVPVFVLSAQNQGDVDVDQYDFSAETNLALEWTYPEAFIPYDERGGNLSNTLSFADAVTTDDVRSALRSLSPPDSLDTKLQWVPMEILVKPVARTDETVVADVAGASWNPANFSNTYLSSYTGVETPLEKYRSDLLAMTGQDINNHLSTKSIPEQHLSFLPPRLPYLAVEGDVGGYIFPIEVWSALPSDRRHQITVSLLREQTQTDVVLSSTWYGSEIDNVPLTLSYRGATEADEAVIESYGGIHQTPPTLVNITPYLSAEDHSDERTTANTVQIGEALVTRFTYSLPILGTQSWRSSVDTVLSENDKFSTAGNAEGIFMSLSRVEANPTLDTNEKKLISGSPELAREYLVRLLNTKDTVGQSLNHESHIVFARAVVTQNRILNRVNGVASTFDFKGLTLDAAGHINDYSNTGNYADHRETFRRVWGLDASQSESKIFEDIAGLESISTVKGLRHAYQNPGVYTVYTITQSTPDYETLVGGLTISQNTKDNIIADIRDRNHTVITPNQPVTLGAFTGQLYISLSPGWTGTYAIGEQTGANGGYSTVPMGVQTYVDENGIGRSYQSAAISSSRTFLHKDSDRSSLGSVDCSNENVWRTIEEARPDWLPAFGFACMEGTVHFGDVEHRYIIAANATKFYRADNYNYWAHNNVIKNEIDAYVDSLPRVDKEYDYRFSPALGTYLLPICTNTFFGGCPDDDEANVYYSPYQNGSDIGRAYRLDGATLAKASDNNNTVIKILGFPVSDVAVAAESFADTEGWYQNFVNGQIYQKTSGIDRTYYVAGQIAEFYNDSSRILQCRIMSGLSFCGAGSDGYFGFPTGDSKEIGGGIVEQQFEGEVIVYDPIQFVVLSRPEYKDERRQKNLRFAQEKSEKTKKGELADIQAFADIANYIASKVPNDEEFVKDITVLFVGVENLVPLVDRLFSSTVVGLSKLQIERSAFSDTGFKFKYSDSHYCLANDAGERLGVSNQLYHSMGGFNPGYWLGSDLANLGNIFHEQLQNVRLRTSAFGTGGSSKEDSELTDDMSALGNELFFGVIHKEDIGREIISRFAVRDLASAVRTREQLIQECANKKYFRDYEMTELSAGGFFEGRFFEVPLLYTKDADVVNGQWTQEYERFGASRNVRAVLDLSIEPPTVSIQLMQR